MVVFVQYSLYWFELVRKFHVDMIRENSTSQLFARVGIMFGMYIQYSTVPYTKLVLYCTVIWKFEIIQQKLNPPALHHSHEQVRAYTNPTRITIN